MLSQDLQDGNHITPFQVCDHRGKLFVAFLQGDLVNP
jgi:hypothetical protein